MSSATLDPIPSSTTDIIIPTTTTTTITTNAPPVPTSTSAPGPVPSTTIFRPSTVSLKPTSTGSINVITNAPNSNATTSSGLNTGAIVGIVVGSVLFVFLIVLAIIIFSIRQKSKKDARLDRQLAILGANAAAPASSSGVGSNSMGYGVTSQQPAPMSYSVPKLSADDLSYTVRPIVSSASTTPTAPVYGAPMTSGPMQGMYYADGQYYGAPSNYSHPLPQAPQQYPAGYHQYSQN